jgi:hypothetical protein
MLSPVFPRTADRMSAALSVQNERAPNYATAARPFYRVEILKPRTPVLSCDDFGSWGLWDGCASLAAAAHGAEIGESGLT